MIILVSKKKKRQKSELEIQNATKRTNPAYIESCLHYKKLTKFHELTNESKITISVREDLNLNSLYEIYLDHATKLQNSWQLVKAFKKKRKKKPCIHNLKASTSRFLWIKKL